MNFKDVSSIFADIAKISSRIEITTLLADLYKQATPEEARIISYMALGTLRPPYRVMQFGIAVKSMTKIIAELLGIPVDEIQQQAHELGDLGAVVAQHSWKQREDFSVHHLYEELCAIERIGGSGSQEEKLRRVIALLKKVDSLSASIIVRIILGTLRLGFSDMTLIDALSWMISGDKSHHKAIEHAYNICADLGEIAFLIRAEGIKGLTKVSITVGIPIRPAAAERLPTAEEILKKIGPCVAQPKIDGFRLQVHVDHRGEVPQLWFFSRNLIDMSSMFPDLVKAFADYSLETLIVEGEAIGFDEKTQRFLPFQETVKRKRKHDIEEVASDFPLKLILFDILYFNGQSLLAHSQAERYAMLNKIFGKYPNKNIAIIEERPINDVDDVERNFIEALSLGFEGLVFKRPDAPYQPGKRNFNWIKLKRHEQASVLEDTLDCVILGYYFGSGKRSHFGIGAFLVGVYNKSTDMYETIAKIGTGLSDEDWKDLKKRCDERMAPEKPHNVICSRDLEPNVWVYPELVCTIQADEITQSPLHTAGKSAHETGFALRFPRFQMYRFDKSPKESTTVDEVRRMYHDQVTRR